MSPLLRGTETSPYQKNEETMIFGNGTAGGKSKKRFSERQPYSPKLPSVIAKKNSNMY